VAPECAAGRSVDERTDVFSFGVLAYLLVAGFPPYCGAEKRAGKDGKVANVPFWNTAASASASAPAPAGGKASSSSSSSSSSTSSSSSALLFPSPHFDAVSPQCRDFLGAVLRLAPGERLTAAQALAHPWLQSAASAAGNRGSAVRAGGSGVGAVALSAAVNPHAVASLKEFLKMWRARLSR
jgi:serine/threonine protein kinase